MLEIPKSALEAEVQKAMQWRYATQQFDRSRKIPSHTFDMLLETMRLTPSSLGLQPWKFIVVNNMNVRRELRDHSWDQPQVTEASHFVVLCSYKKLDDSLMNKHLEQLRLEWGLNRDDLQSMNNLYRSFLADKSPVEMREWMGQQVYIVLGNVLAAAALCGIDACPMEAFNKEAYKEILGTDRMGVEPRVAVALGYRVESDIYAKHDKVRFPQRDIIHVIT